MSEISKPIAFCQLLDQCQRIEVPLIQRDYAQGRATEKDVRDSFLNALHAALALPPGSSGLPLNLDFVYGSKEDGGYPSFLPLDGQQRLTTLFLLHWYLAWRDGQLADFKQRVWDGKHSRFTYGVRPSSTEFFDELVNYIPASPPDQVPTLRRLLEDQPWLFLHWRLDPTVQSVLTMLEAVHDRFKNTAGLYARLVDVEHPVITFHLLPLEHFGLTDDLYIKMNARGKPLTSFETFKARFEDHLRDLFPTEKRHVEGAELAIPDFFESRIDTRWTDFFWHYQNPATHTFDDAVMNLLWALARVGLDPTSASFTDDTTRLRSKLLGASYTTFHESGWLSRTFAHNLICLLEAWSQGGGKMASQLPDARYFDEAAFFRRAITDPAVLEYTELVQFAAFVSYLRHHDGALEVGPFQEWMRVVYNLAANTDIERPEEYGRCLAGLQKLLPYSAQILQRLTTMEIEHLGFSPQQVREEVLKAKLLLSDPAWRGRLDAAERHGYLSGQIDFLLDFAGATAQAGILPVKDWGADVHTKLQTTFDRYAKMVQATFTQDGLAPTATPHLWKRALLAVGDYRVRFGSNYSFLTNPPKNGDSWKRFLRGGASAQTQNRQHLKTLWDRMDPDSPAEPQLSQIITTAAGLDPWRAAVVKYPELLSYCGQQEIRWEEHSNEIYLLKKRQMNGSHAELFSYALYQELATEAARKSLEPLKLQSYQSVCMTETEPHILLSFEPPKRFVSFAVESSRGQFRIHVGRSSLATVPDLEAMIRNKGRFTEEGELLAKIVPRLAIHDELHALAQSLTNLPHPPPQAA